MTSFWTKAPLGTLIVEGPSNGYSPPSEKGAEGTLTLKLSATTTGRFIANDATTKRIHEVIAPDSRYWLRPGDVLIQRSNTLEYVGTAALFEGPETTFIYPDLMMRVRPGPVLDARYLVEFLNAPATRKRVRAKATGTAGNMPKINGDVVRSIEVDVPPLNEQRRIVAKLEALQDRSRRAREALDAVPPLLEKLRQSILAAAFRGDLTKDWRAKNPDVEPADKLLARIRTERRKKWEDAELAKLKAKGKPPSDDKWKAKYEEPASVDSADLPSLPAGWAWTSFETVAEVDLGRQRAPQYLTGRHNRPYLRVANVKDDRLALEDVHQMDFDEEDFDHYQLVPGDILLSEGQSPELVGQSAIYRGGVEGLCFQKTLHRFRAYQSGPRPEFAQLVFRYYVRSGVFRSVASLTTNIAHLTLVRLKALHFPVPPAQEQEEITRRAGGALARIDVLEGQLDSLCAGRAELDRSLLAKAFRGELVPQDPADEPAEVMLARLRGDGAPSSDSPAVSTKRARVGKRKVG